MRGEGLRAKAPRMDGKIVGGQAAVRCERRQRAPQIFRREPRADRQLLADDPAHPDIARRQANGPPEPSAQHTRSTTRKEEIELPLYVQQSRIGPLSSAGAALTRQRSVAIACSNSRSASRLSRSRPIVATASFFPPSR